MDEKISKEKKEILYWIVGILFFSILFLGIVDMVSAQIPTIISDKIYCKSLVFNNGVIGSSSICDGTDATATGGGISWGEAINGTLATWEQVMNGTVGGGAITWANILNGTMAKTSDLINYNSSGLIIDWNSTGYIKNWQPEITSANTSLYNWIVAQGYTAGAITWANAMNGTLFTTALFNTNYTANDGAYRSITNTSYYLGTNPFAFYNVTTAPIYLNDTFRGTNYTTFLTHLTNATMNKSVSCTSIIGGSDGDYCADATGGGGSGANVTTTTCSGTDKVSAINNNTGAVTCTTDSTSAGGGKNFENYTLIQADYISSYNNATLWNVTNLTMQLSPNSFYEINCDILSNSTAVTTGARLRVNTTGTPTSVSSSYCSPGSASAIECYSGINTESNTFLDLGNTAVSIGIGQVISYVKTGASLSVYTVEFQSELYLTGRTELKKGTTCRSVKII